ncbi:hypothetical protein PHAVU_011G172400 [Phaseolus vulgaris]|uniref:Uncharacterized protein n=1 Tax=Phaseolus vulgaris TaxID=3885 RepID=V7AIC5_PHAVU|nr:hypothetical protein PHAVU_011G172400g [Phaseolus vulgaris]ESW05352.1 hypothetical protein PHAVU_011G172400g [Phaseolus vulgaris]
MPKATTKNGFNHKVQQESVDDAERNHFLVNYVDCAFDDFGGSQPPVYPGLSTVWGSLARSKVLACSFFIASTGVFISILFIPLPLVGCC